MADISTGSQRGIVPFVDETTGRLPDQYLPQGVIDLQGDLEQAVSDAGASATAAQQSASQAQSNATAAGSAAQAAAASAESAQTATESAASSKDAAAQSASEASESAQAAEASKTNAASSASAAETSKTNAAASASAAKASETNAAASATAAQQAVDGFGLEAGTTTTGDPGTDAAVDIQKTGTKYTANFTIPRGDKGEQASVTHDGTLTGDGTETAPLGVADGTAINPIDKKWNNIDLNDYYTNGIYTFNGVATNGLIEAWDSGAFIVIRSYQAVTQIYFSKQFGSMAVRYAAVPDMVTPPTAEDWSAWREMASMSDIPDVSALTSRIATLQAGLDELAVMQTRLQALEARVKSLETNQ